MGAMYPVSSVTALENQPEKARSVLSGLFLPGYSLGYILAMVFYRAFKGTFREGEGWRALFWFSAGLPVILILWRFFIPESAAYLQLKENKAKLNGDNIEKNGFLSKIDTSVWLTIKTEWVLFIYLVLLLTAFNFTTHGSQDLYVTLLTKQYNVDQDLKTIIVVVSNLAGIVGGVVVGAFTELFGRRLSIIFCMIWCGTFIYPAFFHAKSMWWANAFLNAGVMGAWGIAPIHLLELVNATHRAFLSGVVYQLGNLASSAASTIEARLGERFPVDGQPGIYDYGKVMTIFCGAVFAFMILITLAGPERFHRDLSIHAYEAVEESSSEQSSSSYDKKSETSSE
ncbi:major facilitator superfamily domain-containing protein [Scheffersomyces xylosifermentans]|uniref:major facilitator superfamily domain-containing protein n=1 Tax=Scheffersomyces xylosifermentans TaxID=1304137 RepID=UPI00315DF7C9